VAVSALDAVVFVGSLLAILMYGMWKGRGQSDTDAYLRANRSLPWWTVLLSVMATQASAITFLSAPGQAYTDGMRFVQYYFGLPIAMVVISAVFIPIFRRQNIYTAYEYLEHRFDRRTRVTTSILFLVSRGLSTGISIYAPSIIVSTILGWNIYLTNVLVGGLLMVYTWRGGARAVAHTQTVMFAIIMTSMAVSVYFLLDHLPAGMGFSDAVLLAGKSGALNVITTDVDLNDKYNLLSGIVGGFFLALSYFGTDQSQVGRFISGKGVEESRKGMLMNGIVKVPMQFGILFIGALLVALYAVLPAPIFFNDKVSARVEQVAPEQAAALGERWSAVQSRLTETSQALVADSEDGEIDPAVEAAFKQATTQKKELRSEYQAMVRANGIPESNDANYVFLHFVRTVLPAGLIGLIFAIIIMASWGSISAALHSLATASYMDLGRRTESGIRNTESGKRETENATQRTFSAFRFPLSVQTHTLLWGVFGIAVSMAATRMGSLIEAVNVLGSLFYGPILGIFLTAFFIKRAGGRAVFYGAVIAEVVVFSCWWFDVISFLWLNAIGAFVVMGWAWVASSGRASGNDPGLLIRDIVPDE